MLKRPRMLNEPERSKFNLVFGVLCVILLFALVVDLWFTNRYFVVEISGGSMENTLFDGDVVYADRCQNPERGDIVIIDVTQYREKMGFSGNYIIKRLIALEGDTVLCKNQTLYLKKKGETKYTLLEEPYTDFRTRDFGEIVVGEGEIFFLGDHRTNSVDSRSEFVGCLKMTDVVGVVPSWALNAKTTIASWEHFRSKIGF